MRRVGILSLVGIALGLPSVAWGAAPAHAALPGAAASGAPTPNGPGEGEQLVVIGTTGLTWHDAVNGRLAATAELLRSRRAALANVASGAGQSDTCGVETWRELAPLVSAVLADARPAATTAPIALGPGAIIASETAGVDAGAVPGLTPAGYPDEVRRGLAAGARLVLVDAGSDGNLPLAQVDQRIADIASAAPRARVLVVSLCHPTQRQFGLGAYIDPVSPDPAGATSSWSTLTSPATRHRGLVTLADLADLATRAPASAGPSRITEDPAPARAPWAAPLADDSLHALAGAAIVGWAYLVVIPAGIACLIPVARFARTGRRAHEAALTRTCLAIAAAGAGSYVANLFPWWRAGPPGGWAVGLVFAAATCTMAGLITAVALALPRRWRPTGPPAFVAAVTVAVIAVDAMSSSSLGWGAPMGPNPVHGGRFFGIPNVEFAYLTAAALVLATFLLAATARAPRRLTSVFWGVTALIGVGLTVIDSAPQFGADVGGSFVILPSFAMFALQGARIRLTPWRIAGAGFLGVAAFGAVTLGDWLRGPDRWTHAGAFGEGMMEGQGGDVIVRKALSSLVMSGRSLPIVVPLILVGVWTWRRIRGTQDVAEYRRAVPLAGACLVGLTTMAVVGGVANDSGIAGMAMGYGLALLLLLAAAPPATRT